MLAATRRAHDPVVDAIGYTRSKWVRRNQKNAFCYSTGQHDLASTFGLSSRDIKNGRDDGFREGS
jgi:hypothetical protein